MNTTYTKHKSPENYVELDGSLVKNLKVDMNQLYITTEKGLFKATKNGFRKIKKLKRSLAPPHSEGG